MGQDEGARRYRAFVSYSHTDAAAARRLHRRLEAYTLPRRLVGRVTAQGRAPRRLAPIFRDREELPAAADLSCEVRAALSLSDSLLVVCSPAAARSPWVAREIELFRELHPERPVLTALVDGEPAVAFADPLRAGGGAEPLAADLRPGHDGVRLGLLKLVAGILGLGLDELVQRDAQRRLRRVTAVTAAAAAALLAMSVLTVVAVQARAEAERQRAHAEGLVDFMLTDLRDKLRQVGRLDVMARVDRRALAYYAGQDLRRLPAMSLERRARVLHAMGEDASGQGRDAEAAAAFAEAARTTAALLREKPGDAQRIFTHAQSEYWIGFYAMGRGRNTAALTHFKAYKTLADRLVAIAPANTDYLHEAAYAEGNLCALATSPPSDPPAALKSCRAALVRMQQTAQRSGHPQTFTTDLINRHAWLANALQINGDLAGARLERDREEALLTPLMRADDKDMDLEDTWLSLRRAYADLNFRQGHTAAGCTALRRAEKVSDKLRRIDSNNQRWRKQQANVTSTLRLRHCLRIAYQ